MLLEVGPALPMENSGEMLAQASSDQTGSGNP
jgi:hypothetical protein